MSEWQHDTIPTHILVLDRDQCVHTQIRDMLNQQGIVANAAFTAEDAINELRYGRYTVLVMDMLDDRTQTVELIRNLHHNVSHIQIILHTDQNCFETAKLALNLGVFAYVEKSDNQAELLATIHRAIHQSDTMALRRSEMRFATIVNDLSDMVIRYQPDGRITFANRVFLDLFNLTTMQLTGRHICEFIEPTQSFELDQLLEQFSPHNAVVTMDVKMKIPRSSETWFRWTNRAIYDQDNTLQEIQSALHDITDAIYSERYLLSRVALSANQLDMTHKQLAEEIANHRKTQNCIRQREAELAHVARLNIMGEMASSIAHELNQPLAAIANYTRGCVKRLENMDNIPPAIVQAMESAAKQSERAGHILRRLRDLVQKRSTHIQPMYLTRIFEEVSELLAPVIVNEGIKLQVNSKLDSQLVNVDSIQIQQVFINLIRNAVDAMKPVKPDQNKITINMVATPDNMAKIEVIDQGHGLKGETPEHLFDMFFSTRDQGMGMGLAICRTIIESHGGQCFASDHPDGGAVFGFTLPIHHPANQPHITITQQQPARPQ